MANMSHCRFQNTLQDLRDCWRSWDGDPDDDDGLSKDEKEARAQLVNLCKQIAGNCDDPEEDQRRLVYCKRCHKTHSVIPSDQECASGAWVAE